ncbi:MAG: lipopolysaccharide biosynthesis protein [Bacteroidetes bacterium]|nr:lipopolysaccharide biosynthesis protein [Bacteroidota bacterium]
MSEQPSTPKEISLTGAVEGLKKLFQFFFSKWVIICIIGFSGAGLGLLYGWLEKPNYQAVLSFSTDDDKATTTGIMGIAAQFGINLGGVGGVFSGDNILSLISSQKIVKQALFTPVQVDHQQENLLSLYYESSGMKKSFRKDTILQKVSFPLNQDPEKYSRVQDSVLQLILKDISKKVLVAERPDKRVLIYTITVISPSETFSKAFSEELITRVTAYYVASSTTRSYQTVEILQERADSVKRAYDAALQGRAALSDANLNPAFQSPLVGIQKKQTDITVLATAYGELLKNLELSKFNLLRETPLIQVIDEPMLPLKVIKTGRLLGTIYGGLLAGFLCICYLTFIYMLRNEKLEQEASSD